MALLVRTEWIDLKARRNLIHWHPWFAGVVMLTARPRWVPREQETGQPAAQLRLGGVGRAPRVGDPWIRCAGKAPPSL